MNFWNVMGFITLALLGALLTLKPSKSTKSESNIFEKGNTVRNKKSGILYTVIESDIGLCFAFLEDKTGRQHVVSWMYPSGAIDDSVFTRYERIEK